MLPLLLDADDVLLRFSETALPIINQICGLTLKLSDLSTWDYLSLPEVTPFKEEIWDAFKQRGFVRDLKPFPEAQEAVQKIQEMGVPIQVITAPIVSAHFYDERVANLWQHFRIRQKAVGLMPDKSGVRGIALVDDKPQNAVDWAQMNQGDGHKAFLWETDKTRNLPLPRTIGNLIRTSNWQDVIDYCLEMKGKS